MFPDLDYARLQRSFEYFVEHYSSTDVIVSARHELAATIKDFVESTEDFCGERLAEIDRDLQKRGGYTLTFLREVFT